MDRSFFFERVIKRDKPWDIAIIGGGATGGGVAVDAASRGYDVILLEQSDFGKGTSSRSTKLVHGGVRYLQQGNIPLVMEALKERGILLQNAPHLVHDLQFIVPHYQWWEIPFYGIGLKTYDLLAGKYKFGRSRLLSKEKVLEQIPTLESVGLRGGVIYHDGQFDDSRLLINLIQTAYEQGACLLNYTQVNRLLKNNNGFINGLEFVDHETNKIYSIPAHCVVNATGPFCDNIIKLDDSNTEPIIDPSQGVHIVLPHDFIPNETALMVPHTKDGRVMFAIPWNNHIVVGTTDTPISNITLEPQALEDEVNFILETVSDYLTKKPSKSDVLSIFTGIRPLVNTGRQDSTAILSRDHTTKISKSGLLTITGGKWTTYRKMAEEAVDQAVILGKLEKKPCITRELRIHGYHQHSERFGDLAVYGSDAVLMEELAHSNNKLKKPIHESLPINGLQVIWAVRHEMARTVDDVLSRRTRALYLNVKAAREMAPHVAQLMADELGYDETWIKNQITEFEQIARRYDVNFINTD